MWSPSLMSRLLLLALALVPTNAFLLRAVSMQHQRLVTRTLDMLDIAPSPFALSQTFAPSESYGGEPLDSEDAPPLLSETPTLADAKEAVVAQS